jgi:hypothetical protein
MSEKRIVVVADDLDFESIIRGLINSGVPASRLHVSRFSLTEEMVAVGVFGDLPEGRLLVSAVRTPSLTNRGYDGVTGTYNCTPVGEEP